MGRVAQVQREIEFVRAREADYHVMVDLLAAGKLPLRVTHNDTKLNNIHGIALLKLSIPTWTISTFCLRPHHKYNYPNWLTIIKLLLLDLFVKTLVSNSNSIIGSHIFGAIVTLCVAFRTEQNRL